METGWANRPIFQGFHTFISELQTAAFPAVWNHLTRSMRECIWVGAGVPIDKVTELTKGRE